MTLLPIKRREMSINDLARVQNEMQDMMRSFFGNLDMPGGWQSVAWPAPPMVLPVSEALRDRLRAAAGAGPGEVPAYRLTAADAS